MKQSCILLSMIGSALLLAACGTTGESNTETIQGSGNVITSAYEVKNFSRIQVDMGADLVLIQGEGEHLTIEADDNLMQYIKAQVHSDKLVISLPDNISLEPTRTIQLVVGFNALSAIEINGSSAITGTDLDLDALAIRFSGSGSTQLTGTVDEQAISVQGLAIINNFDLTSRRVVINISGNGTVEVNALDTLNVTVAGMGSIHYMNNPMITQNVSGTATIVHRS